MSSAPMRTLVELGHRPHSIDRKKYGQPRVALYYARRRRFTHPGLYLWAFSRHWRLFPTARGK